MAKNFLYPFTAIVGQEKMKEALILNIINPSLGGILIRGEKGTAKSILVRALANLLAEREENSCEFHCEPDKIDDYCPQCNEKYLKGEKIEKHKSTMKVINLPISATEDRVVGTLDIEHAIKTGEKKFEKGLLAQSNRNILYVDEINLLDDHIVDVLLDSAAMGVNTIEREGISYSHPAKRVEVIKRRLDFEAEPEKFIKKYLVEEEELKNRIENSKKRLNNIKCSDEIYELAAKISIALNVDGHRADIAVVKTAITIAAFENREEVIKEDILRAAVLALPHRMRKTPFEDGILDEEQIEKLVNSLTM